MSEHATDARAATGGPSKHAELADLVGRIDRALCEFLAGRRAALEAVGADLRPLAEAGESFVLDGGKRLRPLFAYWGWRAVRPASADDAGILTAAASLELLHACALAHDDVMDGSATRRGRSSAHATFAAMHASQGFTGDPHVFGTAAAILLGDLLLCWADAMFAGADFDPATMRRARQIYDDMRQQVMAGQYLDALVQARGNFSPDEALRVIRYKTSKYTVEGPLLFGAAVADAPADVQAALRAYGVALGEAFQLRDDLLGVFGDPGSTGKPAGDDLREGKRTLLVALAMRRAERGPDGLLRAGLGDRELDDERVRRLRELIVSTGAVDEIERRITARAGDAQAALAAPGIDPQAREVLRGLVVAATDRRG